MVQRREAPTALAVQVVEILWSKATRGAPRSNERAALPRAFPMLPSPTEGAVFVLQRHCMAEWVHQFSPRLEETTQAPEVPCSLDVLRLAPLPQGGFLLGWTGTPHGGQPRRAPSRSALKLMPGQYARLVLNARHTNYSGQYYSETIYHLACGTSGTPERFTQGPPDHDLDLKAYLV